MTPKEPPLKMTCRFCPRELDFYHESFDYMGFLSARNYKCYKCGTQYTRSVRTNPYPDNQVEWEELTYYEIDQEGYHAKFYLYPQPSCVISKDEGHLTWIVLKFKFHPKNLTPFNLASKAKTWVLFS